MRVLSRIVDTYAYGIYVYISTVYIYIIPIETFAKYGRIDNLWVINPLKSVEVLKFFSYIYIYIYICTMRIVVYYGYICMLADMYIYIYIYRLN